MTTSTRRITEPDVSPDEREALKLWIVLSRARGAIGDRAAAHIAHYGMTLAEFGVLESLYHKGPMLLGEIQRGLLVSSGGVTYLVDRLERRGLVRRDAFPDDRRARLAVLTAEGTAFVRRVFPEHAAAVHAAMSGLTPEEQRLATGLLKKLGLGAARTDGSPQDVGDDGADRPQDDAA
jgi:MarR family 2-MHQ and catechol resistance regulon transcriptional repressor